MHQCRACWKWCSIVMKRIEIKSGMMREPCLTRMKEMVESQLTYLADVDWRPISEGRLIWEGFSVVLLGWQGWRLLWSQRKNTCFCDDTSQIFLQIFSPGRSHFICRTIHTTTWGWMFGHQEEMVEVVKIRNIFTSVFAPTHFQQGQGILISKYIK